MRSLGGRCNCCQSLARAARIRLRHDASRSLSTTLPLAVNGASEPVKLPSRNWGELKTPPPAQSPPQRKWGELRGVAPRRSWGQRQDEVPNPPPAPSGSMGASGAPQGSEPAPNQFQPRNQFARPNARNVPSRFGVAGPSRQGAGAFGSSDTPRRPAVRQPSPGFQDRLQRLNGVRLNAGSQSQTPPPARPRPWGGPQYGESPGVDLGPPEASGFGLVRGPRKASTPQSKFGSDPRSSAPPSKFGAVDRRKGPQQPGLKGNARRAALDMRDGAEADEPDFDDEATEMGEDGEIMKSKRKAGAKASMSFKDRMAMMADGAEEFEITRGRGVKGDRGQSTTMTLEEREKAERRRLKEEGRKAKQRQAERQVFIPSSVTVSRLAGILGLKWSRLQIRMAQLGMSEEQRRSDYMLSEEEAVNVALEFGFDPRIDDEAFFDIVPQPDPPSVIQPLRPPIVTIMGHVDHGKTTLLDSLRNTAVAAGEAGGITQHIGAFSVALSSLQGATAPSDPAQDSMITFLDTPGHAAFTEMRARGATVTDIVVLVVAADDGVMPQTREVLNLVKEAGDDVGLVVAINKVDKHGVDIERIKGGLGAEGIHLEEDGGDVPSVKVSGLTKLGLDNLVETLSTLAELRELRARVDGQAEGYVLESNKDQGKGSVATILITKGTLHTGSYMVAGTTFCRVRTMMNDQGTILHTAGPGTPVQVTGWRDLPEAGDQLLESVNGEHEARKAINNRIAAQEQQRMLADTDVINTKRQEDRLRHQMETEEERAIRKDGGNVTLHRIEQARRAAELAKENAVKELRLIIKGDVSGTVEAVEGALSGIGNKEAVVKIVSTGVGAISESDLTMAEATDGLIIGFNVDCSKHLQQLARQLGVSVHLESVIYRLIDTVRQKTAALLPPAIEYRTLGEATVQQIFEISLKKKQKAFIAGCKVNQGTIKRGGLVRVFRGANRVLVFEGNIETLKHLKKDVEEMRKGTECGMGLAEFKDLRAGDEIVAVNKVEVPRTL